MVPKNLLLLAFLTAFFGAALVITPGMAAQKLHAMARIKALDGKPLGTATFSTVNRGVLIELDLTGLSPGPHGMHLHVSGNCDPKTGFTSAGPILALSVGHAHGFLARKGPLTGDLPNQYAGADGHLHASTVTSGFSLGDGVRSIFDRDGVSLILTPRGDDYATQPFGNAGTRIACGVVVRGAKTP